MATCVRLARIGCYALYKLDGNKYSILRRGISYKTGNECRVMKTWRLIENMQKLNGHSVA